MANTLYDNAREQWALGNIAWADDTFYCLLVDSRYDFDVGHEKLTAIDGAVGGMRDHGADGPGGKIIAGRDVDPNGAIYGDSVRFATVDVAPNQIQAIVIYRYADGVDSNADLIYYADVATGLPITPNGGDIIVTWSTGTNRILRL